MSANPPRQWILLRGLTRECAHWGAFAARLQQALPGERVLALDLPGNGLFHTQSTPVSVHGMVRACRHELALRCIAPPYHVLAMSLGAMVATEPIGQPAIARTWFSNCEVTAPSSVQWPEL